MSTDTTRISGTLAQTTTRRSFMKRIAAGTAAAALLAAARAADASPPIANREMGNAPVIGGASSFRSPASAPKRYERRTPE
jgi:hypothetical protein